MSQPLPAVYGKRMMKHRRAGRAEHAAHADATTSTTARAPATTTTRTRATTSATDDNNDAPTTTTARVRTTATSAGAAAGTSVAVTAVTVTTTPGSLAVLSSNAEAAASASAIAANAIPKPTTASSKGLSTGAKAGIAIGATLVGLLLIGLVAVQILRRRKSNNGTKLADYSWSSKEKDANFGTSPSRNVKSDASFGNSGGIAAFGGMRRMSNSSDRRELLGGGAATGQPQALNAPRASFMDGPSGPPPSIGSMYGATNNAAPPAIAAAAGQQQSPFADPPYNGKIYVVRRTFEPSLADELIIYPGDKLQILQSFDDGWCLGVNLDSAKPGQPPQRGVFPRDCVDEMTDDMPLATGPGGLQRAPTLPPMNFEGGGPPAISVSSPESAHAHSQSNQSQILSRFPATPGHRDSKRTSSMLAGQDSDLFSQMRIGEQR